MGFLGRFSEIFVEFWEFSGVLGGEKEIWEISGVVYLEIMGFLYIFIGNFSEISAIFLKLLFLAIKNGNLRGFYL